MAETLVTPSGIKMYGRVMSGLQYFDDTAPVGNNNFLQRQLAAGRPSPLVAPLMPVEGKISEGDVRKVVLPDTLGDISVGMLVTAIHPDDPKQIFSPGTHIVSVTHKKIANNKAQSSPASFSVSADPLVKVPAAGLTVPTMVWNLGVYLARIYAFSFEGGFYGMPKPAIFVVHGAGTHIDPDHFRGIRSSVDQSGVVAKEWEFAGSADLRYWEYDKGDFSLRLDTESGPLDQLMLQASLRSGGDRADRSGASLEIRSGASLSGASLSGASLSGASLSGASLKR